MDISGRGKTALVTGASRGIGKGIALVLASEGYDLAITYSTKKEQAEETAHIIETEHGRKCIVFQASLEMSDVPAVLVTNTVKELGRLDVLVNNAGLSQFADIATMDVETLDILLNLNFRGPVLALQAAANHMIERGIKGNIVFITSSRAERAYPGDGIYGGLKAASVRAVQSFALDLARYDIRVNCVAPGATMVRAPQSAFYKDLAPRIPLGRIGPPTDIGNAIAWLVSDKASYITGVNIRIDGGLILPGMPETPTPVMGNSWGFLRKNDRAPDDRT